MENWLEAGLTASRRPQAYEKKHRRVPATWIGDTGGLIGIAEAGAEVEAGATESGAWEPPQAELDAGQYEDEPDVRDDVDEVEEGKVLLKGDYGDNSPSKSV